MDLLRPAQGSPVGLPARALDPRFPLLDAVRALAALSVLAFHTALTVGAVRGGVAGLALQGLQVRFEVFFVMSGFLLYRPFVSRRFAGRPPRPLRRYGRARLLRIVPAYWLALTVLLLWPGLVNVHPGNAALYYGFAQTYSRDTIFGGIVPAWTLCTEVLFYAAVPLYAALLRRLARGAGGGALLTQELIPLGLLAAASVALRVLAPPQPTLLYTLPEWVDAYALGMALAVVSVAVGAANATPRLIRLVEIRPGACWALAAVPYVLGAWADRRGSSHLLVHVLYELVALLFILPAVFGDDRGGLPRRILSLRWLAAVGTISYGIYLWHWTIAHYLRWHGGADWLPGSAFLSLLVATLAVTIACATLSYVLVERPFLRRKAPRAERRRTEEPATVAAAAAL